MQMMKQCRWIPRVVMVVLGITMAAAGLAQTSLRLPENYVFTQGNGSPGKVTFSHLTHVDQKKPDCIACHPALFKILEKGSPAQDERIRHSSMEADRQCGACHDGKAAFGLNNCVVCHRRG
jgi:c(7)-type cytochrome triheme protein